ncbi:hypothetical protein NLG97_g6347 [Lecanicillium saksenae]|uniref:Uncharacterized protein n=1 Tax=Lecanicillium saksenae TaxID=468837 RepID=A0ACC1QRK8_9HYPO|nr:hypothetical protein NLG97_g6347 [Lecanicillium saksenae]
MCASLRGPTVSYISFLITISTGWTQLTWCFGHAPSILPHKRQTLTPPVRGRTTHIETIVSIVSKATWAGAGTQQPLWHARWPAIPWSYPPLLGSVLAVAASKGETIPSQWLSDAGTTAVSSTGVQRYVDAEASSRIIVHLLATSWNGDLAAQYQDRNGILRRTVVSNATEAANLAIELAGAPIAAHTLEERPLHAAVRSQHYEAAKQLLKSIEVDPNGLVGWGQLGMHDETPFEAACRCSGLRMVKLLHDDPRILVDGRPGRVPPIVLAFRSKRHRTVELLLQSSRVKDAHFDLMYYLITKKQVFYISKMLQSPAVNIRQRAQRLIELAQDNCLYDCLPGLLAWCTDDPAE